MKTKNFKRVLTLVLALAMMLSLSMVSFATGDDDITVYLYTVDYDYIDLDYETPVLLYSFGADVNTGDTLYDILTDPNNPDVAVLDTDWHIASGLHYLEGITYNNASYPDIRVEAAASCYNYDDEYIGGNTIIDALNQLDEFEDYDGVYLSMYMLMEQDSWKGYYIMGDMEHLVSITFDWIYEVSTDGGDTFARPMNNYGKFATIDEYHPAEGDIVKLTYGLVWEFFTLD